MQNLLRLDKNNNLEYLFEIAIDIIAIIGTDSKIKRVSKSCNEILGWNEKEVISVEWSNFIHQDDLLRILGYKKTSNIKDEIKGLEFKVKCKDENYKLLKGNFKYIEEDKVYIVIAKDISEKQKILDEKLAYERAIELEGIKNEFFSNISHEFKTPLNIILATMQLINKNIENKNIISNEEVDLKKYMTSIKQNCYRLLRLVNNIIDMNKIDYGYYDIELGNYNIVSVVEDITMSVLEYIKNKGIELIFDTDTEEEIIACDPDKIERIILNLLSNAIKYTRPDGKIIVNINSDKENVYISVKDTGIGMPKQKLNKIFNRYEQIDNKLTKSFNGSGIGLSLVKSLVEMHKGKITVESKENEGSKFTITLPKKRINNEHIKNTNLTKSRVEKCNIEFSDIYL